MLTRTMPGADLDAIVRVNLWNVVISDVTCEAESGCVGHGATDEETNTLAETRRLVAWDASTSYAGRVYKPGGCSIE